MISPQRQGGFALVTALWASTILALVAGAIIGLGRTGTRIGHNAAEMAVLQAAAEGALAVIELRLLAPEAARPLPLDGTPVTIECAGHRVNIVLQDQAGLIDINAAPAESLRQAFEILGKAEPDTAQALGDRVLDWREHGIGHRLNGAKAEEYQSARLAYGPRERPFASVAELKLVLGMTPSLYELVEPALTVASQIPSVDPAVATRAVLLVLLHGDAAAADAALLERAERKRDGRAPGLEGSVAGKAIRITAEALGPDGIIARQTTVVRFTGFGNAPLWTYPDT